MTRLRIAPPERDSSPTSIYHLSERDAEYLSMQKIRFKEWLETKRNWTYMDHVCLRYSLAQKICAAGYKKPRPAYLARLTLLSYPTCLDLLSEDNERKPQERTLWRLWLALGEF
jgi:hypothetical protein